MQSRVVASRSPAADVVVVGGGLAGLTAATLLARARHRVLLFEKARNLGGRAATHVHGEFRFNIGPHALYRGGQARQILAELGLQLAGGMPQVNGGYAVDRGTKHTLPGGFLSLLTTGLLRLPAKLEVARLLGSLHKIDPRPLLTISVREWLDRNIRQTDVRRLLQALIRLSTYANAPTVQSAGAAVAQLQLALARNVEYLDGGWQVMVDALQHAASTAGAKSVTAARVNAVEHHGGVTGVRLADGSTVSAAAVILALPPDEAATLVPQSDALQRWRSTAIPIKAACLDLGLSRLPEPRARFGLGIDQPLYFSVHSAVAKLAAPGGATIHVAKYLDPASISDPKADEHELESFTDLLQPGWRAAVVERRFLPNMTVYHALVTAAGGGNAGRPGPAIQDIDGLYVAGDWVGPEGLLADASVASAKRAVSLILQRASTGSDAAAA